MKHITPPCARFAFVLLFFIASLGVNAAPRSLDAARAAAKQLMQRNAARRAPGHAATTAEPKLVFTAETSTATQEPAYYIFSQGTDAGYAIVSGDDRLPAIVGYTENGDYNSADMPDGLAAVLQQYRDFLDNATDREIEEIQTLRRAPSRAAVPNFVKTKWGQSAPYNIMCPEYKSGTHSATGCTATAVAQILYYHKTPATLQADIAEYTSKKNKLTLAAISAGEAYDWDNMLAVYKDVEATEAQKNAVAKLMLHVGCAMGMDYGSSSAASALASHFTKYFGMDANTTRRITRSDYQLPEWDGLLYGEMAAKRPVLYTGYTITGGHSFVISGYQDGNYYVNWGWNGKDDGWFDITVLNPRDTSGEGAAASRDGYSRLNTMTIGIQPSLAATPTDMPCPALKCRQLGQEQITDLAFDGNTLTAKVCSLQVTNPQKIKITRQLAIGYRKQSGEIVTVTTPFSKSISSGKYTTIKDPLDVSFAAENDKTYELFLCESTDGQEWFRCQDGEVSATSTAAATHCTVAVTIKDNTPSTSYLISNLSATAALSSTSSALAGQENDITVTVTNNQASEYYKTVYVYVSKSETCPKDETYGNGMSIASGETKTFSFAYTPEETGTYNVWILNSSKKEIGKSQITINAATVPMLVFKSITIDNASGEKTYAGYSKNQVEMDKVNDTKATVKFVVANYGTAYTGEFTVKRYVAGKTASETVSLTFPAESTTPITYEVSGKAGDVVYVQLTSNSTDVAIAALKDRNKHLIDGKTTAYYFVDKEMAYLAGPTDRPALSLLSIRCTNATGEKCYAPYSDTQTLEMDQVEGNKAEYEFVVQNDGAEYAGTFRWYSHHDGKSTFYIDKTLTFPAHTATTLTHSVTSKTAGDVVYTWLECHDTDGPAIAPLETKIKLKIQEKPGYVQLFSKYLPVYVAGDPDGISAPSVSPIDSSAPCYNLNGQRVTGAQRGIVIQGGRKVVRR